MAQYSGSRVQRVGEQIQRELAMLIQQELDDPRFRWVTVSGVKVSRDFAYATVYVSLLTHIVTPADGAMTPQLLIQNLTKVNGYLRRELGHRMRLRLLPQLKFVFDDSAERGTQMSEMIDRAVAQDRKVASDDEDEEKR